MVKSRIFHLQGTLVYQQIVQYDNKTLEHTEYIRESYPT